MSFQSKEKFDTDVPDSFPANRYTAYDTKPIGAGLRMTAYPDKTGFNVIRVPHRTEDDLCRLYGQSDRFVDMPNGGRQPISLYTLAELEKYLLLRKELGSFVADIVTFPDFDMTGALRTYSMQRRIYPKTDLGARMVRPITDVLSQKELKNLRGAIKGIRRLLRVRKLIPDLCNNGNIVSDLDEHIWVIDINNVRPAIPNDEWLRAEGPMDSFALRRMISQSRAEIFATGYLDGHGFAIADRTLARVARWDADIKGVDCDDLIANDYLYARYINRQRIDAVIHLESLRGH